MTTVREVSNGNFIYSVKFVEQKNKKSIVLGIRPEKASPDKIHKYSSVDNISRFTENDNGNNLSKNSGRKFSISVDSNGNKLTEEQAEFFKNSVARDEQGGLLTLYHQTDADFTEFKTKSTGAGRYDDAMPDGVFLKPTSADIGLKGKKQMS